MCVCVCVCWSDEADGTVLGAWSGASLTLVCVCFRSWPRQASALHQPLPEECGLTRGSRCPAGVHSPCTPLAGSIQSQSPCALFLAVRTITQLLCLLHWRSCLQSCRRQKRLLWPICFGGISTAKEKSAQTDNPYRLQRNPWSLTSEQWRTTLPWLWNKFFRHNQGKNKNLQIMKPNN